MSQVRERFPVYAEGLGSKLMWSLKQSAAFSHSQVSFHSRCQEQCDELKLPTVSVRTEGLSSVNCLRIHKLNTKMGFDVPPVK